MASSEREAPVACACGGEAPAVAQISADRSLRRRQSAHSHDEDPTSFRSDMGVAPLLDAIGIANEHDESARPNVEFIQGNGALGSRDAADAIQQRRGVTFARRRRFVRRFLDHEHIAIGEHDAGRGHLRSMKHRDGLDLVGQRNHVERPERRRHVAEVREVVQVSSQRVWVAGDVCNDLGSDSRKKLARKRARSASRRVDDRGVEWLVTVENGPK